MTVIETLDFQPMLITDVFDSLKASSAWYDKNKLAPGSGPFPYVSRSAARNGHESAIALQDLPPNTGNSITIGVDTQTVFYQPVPFYTSVKIQVLRHPRLTAANGPVLVAILREQMMKFQWGNGASLVRLRATRIMVPVTTDENNNQVVDWDGLDRLGAELLDQVITHTHSAVQTDTDDDDTLPGLKFEPMFITDLFETIKASRAWYDKSKLSVTGDSIYPFVSRTKASNGIDGFCSRQDKNPEPGNAVTIGLDTQNLGYQPVPFYTSQNIQVLRTPSLNEDNALVLITLIQEQMGKFSWGGNGATLGRLKKTRIMVPVATDGSGQIVVDWAGMTAHGRALRVRAERSMAAALEVA